MSFKTKSYLMVGAAVIGLALAPQANAQTTVSASLITDSAITVTDGDDMDFGTWFLVFRNADAFELVMDTTGAITATNLAGGPTNSIASELVSVDQFGTIDVAVPTGANGIVLRMSRGVITDMPDVGLTLASPTYGTLTEGANQAFAASPATVPVTVVTGGAGTPEEVSFGATISVTATPANATHTGSFVVTFAY